MKIYYDALSLKPTTSIGTQAYVISGMQIIARKFPTAEFILLSVNVDVDENYLKHTNLNYRLIKRKTSRMGTWKQVRKIVKSVDAVVSSWGDAYISSPPHLIFRKAFMLKKIGKPLVLLTSSIGPIPSGIKRIPAVLGLKLFDAITVRDAITFEHLKKNKLHNIELVHDSAFVLKPEPPEKISRHLQKNGLVGERYVGLNVSVLLLNLFNKINRSYAREMAEYALWMKTRFNMPVVLIPHQIYPSCYSYSRDQYVSSGGDDRYAIDEIMKNIQDRSSIIALQDEYTPMELKGIIRGSDIFIGGRMHSVIGAISTATPALIMEYSHKAGGMMKLLNMEDYVWNIHDRLDDLKRKTEQLWNHKNRIQHDLENELPGIFEKIYGLADFLNP